MTDKARWQAPIEHHERALKYGSDTWYKARDWDRLRKWFGSVCLNCGVRKVTVDHVVPLCLGGVNLIHNLQPLCRRCNKRKGRRIIDYRDPDRLVQLLAALERR